MNIELIKKLEAVIFYLAEPVKLSFLADTLGVSVEEMEHAVEELKNNLGERGVRVIRHDDEVVLSTAPELSETIEKIIKEEREKDLGRAGIETLSIIAYKGPVTKKEIEYIRGVNSQYALRNLLLRGLVEKKEAKGALRMVVYSITGDALRFLGLTSITELPEYEETRKSLEVSIEEGTEENAE